MVGNLNVKRCKTGQRLYRPPEMPARLPRNSLFQTELLFGLLYKSVFFVSKSRISSIIFKFTKGKM